MNRIYLLPLLIALSLTPACSSHPVPGMNIQVGESALQGKLVLPYQIQDGQPTAAQATSPAAISQNAENEIYLVPLTRLDLNFLRASLDGEPVMLEVKQISLNQNQTTVQYYISDLPPLPTERIARLEIQTREGQPLLGGMVKLTPGQTGSYDLDVNTTALMVKVTDTLNSRQVNELTISELKVLELDPSLSTEQASIRFLLRRDGTLKDHLVWSKTWNDGDDNDQ